MDGVLRAWPHPAKLPTRKKVHRQQGEAYTNVIQGRVHWSCSQTWPYHPCGVGFRIMKDTLVNDLWSLPPQLHRAADVRLWQGVNPSVEPWGAITWSIESKGWFVLEIPRSWKGQRQRYLPKRATERRTSQREKCFVIIKTARVKLCLWHQTWCYRI